GRGTKCGRVGVGLILTWLRSGFSRRKVGSRKKNAMRRQQIGKGVRVGAEGFIGTILELRSHASRILLLRGPNDIDSAEIRAWGVQEQNAVPGVHKRGSEHDADSGVVGRLHNGLWRRRLR